MALTAGALTFLCLTGEAFDPSSSRLLYREHHRETWVDGRKTANSTQYVDPEGRLLLEKTARYGAFPSAPDMESLDPRTGESTQVRVSQEGLKIDYRSKKEAEFERTLLPLPKELVVDEGFSELIRLKWDELLSAKEGRDVDFAVPTRGSTYTFVIEALKPKPEGETNEVRFRIRVSNMFLRLLVSPLTMSFELKTRRLLRYEGMTNVPDEKGHNIKARIEFVNPAVPCTDSPLAPTKT